jgi:hypothetical protein
MGTWVMLPEGAVARVTAREEGPQGPLVRAETTDGQVIERPASYAELRWRCRPEAGLAVRRALDPTGVVERAAADPVGLVMAVLLDADGGQASAGEIKAALTPFPIAASDIEHWWKRAQPRLLADGRIDASRARQRTYRLLSAEEQAHAPWHEPVTSELRRGRYLADAPLLLGARKRAKGSGSLVGPERDELEAEARLAAQATLDPTDRFLAAELGVWLGLWAEAGAIEQLGDDLFEVDLTRVRERGSRDAVLRWAAIWAARRERPLEADDPVVRSAVAAGSPWAERAGEAITPKAPLFEWVLGFGIPGAEESGPARYPVDLERYGRRVRAAGALVARLGGDEAAALARGALRALCDLAPSGAHAQARRRLLSDVARLYWLAWVRQSRAQRNRGLAGLDLRPDAWELLIEAAPLDALGDVRSVFEAAYASAFGSLAPAVRTLGQRLHVDPGAIALGVARRQIDAAGAARLAIEAARLATDPATRSESVTLAGTVAPHDPTVEREIARAAAQAAEALLAGEVNADGPLLFTSDSWREFAARIERDIRAAHERADTALAERDAALEELDRIRVYARERQEELQHLRAQGGAQSRGNIYRVAAGLLRPVAAAIADSYEEADLSALRDRLLAVLDRAQILEVTPLGAVQRFDPTRHRWVGDGDPTEWIRALSPAYATQGEGADGVVLVQARVVAAAAPR